MSVLLETSLGDIVIDLEVEACPRTCQNFLKLCKVYYYNLNAFFNVSKDFLAQTGDPTATGTGGESIWSLIASNNNNNNNKAAGGGGDVPRYFAPEIVPHLKHTHKGTVSMAVAPALEGQQGQQQQGGGGCGSQFFITLTDRIDYLDGKHAVFGHVVEGLETLDRLNDVFTDQDGRPLKDVRIRHVEILDDPFPDPPGLVVPSAAPTAPPDNSTRIAEDEDPLSTLPEAEEEKQRRARAAAASALTLEMVGDLPFANVRPPENVLFVCKLNPVTRDEDLELIFSRFGPIMSCQVIRDKLTGDSLQYAFIEFDKREDAEQAYFKMQNVLIDDRRIWVDFSQSVAKLNTHWSNDIKMGPRATTATTANNNSNGRRGAAREGFAGKEDLEPTRRYRVSDENDDGSSSRRGGGGDGYGMVFDVRDAEREYRDRDGARRRRSRSPRRDRDGGGGGKRRRSGSRDRERDRDRYRERERYEDRTRDHGRRRSRSRERYDRRR
ncbi:CYP6 [Sanghuangporus vaninii]